MCCLPSFQIYKSVISLFFFAYLWVSNMMLNRNVESRHHYMCFMLSEKHKTSHQLLSIKQQTWNVNVNELFLRFQGYEPNMAYKVVTELGTTLILRFDKAMHSEERCSKRRQKHQRQPAFTVRCLRRTKYTTVIPLTYMQRVYVRPTHAPWLSVAQVGWLCVLSCGVLDSSWCYNPSLLPDSLSSSLCLLLGVCIWLPSFAGWSLSGDDFTRLQSINIVEYH